jgi:4-hydroxybenzoate polyprenyltransferase
MSGNSNLYKIFQALSLDIVLGAVIFSYAISLYFQSPISYSALTCLAIAIWLIYTADHLLDAQKTIDKPATFRHQFHKQFRKPLVVMAVLLLLIGAVIAYFLPRVILYNGLVGVLLTGIYFLLLQSKSFWQKEVCVAIGYTWGICLAPVCINWGQLALVQLLLIPQVFLLVFANLLIFSWFDMSNDKQDGHQSMVIRWGEKRARIGIILIIVAGVLLSLFTMVFPLHENNTGAEAEPMHIMEAILLLMFGILWLIFKNHPFFRKNEAYRVIGDGIFFIPVLFILYASQH